MNFKMILFLLSQSSSLWQCHDEPRRQLWKNLIYLPTPKNRRRVFMKQKAVKCHKKALQKKRVLWLNFDIYELSMLVTIQSTFHICKIFGNLSLKLCKKSGLMPFFMKNIFPFKSRHFQPTFWTFFLFMKPVISTWIFQQQPVLGNT